MSVAREQRRADPPGVLIFIPHLLLTFQHFVREHALRLRHYRPVLAGRRRVQGTPIDDLPHFTFAPDPLGRFQELRFLFAGRNGALETFIRAHNVEVIHAHFGPGGTEILRVAQRLQLPLVVTFHGWDVKIGAETRKRASGYERLYRLRLPNLLQSASRIIAVSETWRDRLIAMGAHPDKVQTNYLGVDCNFLDGVRGTFESASILFVGRLIRQKGVHLLLEALDILIRRGDNVHLTVVGDGPEAGPLQDMANARSLPVRFVGQKSPREIRDLLRTAGVLCAPSTTAGGLAPEALGLVLIEAQAMSVPVIGTRSGGIPETFEDGISGFLVEDNCPEALAHALSQLIRDKSLNQSFGRAGRAFVSRKFDIATAYRTLENIYDQVRTTG